MTAVGVPAADAAKVAELMPEADLTGADAHGVFRLPQYVRRIKAGGVNPQARHHGREDRAGDRAGRRRQRHGPSGDGSAPPTPRSRWRRRPASPGSARGARNHAGAAGTYAAMALPHDMIGIYSAVANANHMPAWGGAESLLGTNPIAIAIPAGEEAPVVLDIATTVVSYGTVKAYKLQGKPMPEGWMVERQGRQAAHRFRAQRRGPAAADRRLQGRGPGAGARPARRHAQRRGVRPRRGRFQRRRRRAPATPATSSSRSTSRASCRSPPSRPRSTATCAI